MPPFVHRFPVRFADVDHAGIVYYPRFLHYFHVAFEEFFRVRIGAGAYLDLLDRRKIGFPAVHCECDFRGPLRFGDTARVAMWIPRLGRTSIRFHYRVEREDTAAPEGPATLAAEGQVVCAVTDLAHFRAIEIPPDLGQLFLELGPDPE